MKKNAKKEDQSEWENNLHDWDIDLPDWGNDLPTWEVEFPAWDLDLPNFNNIETPDFETKKATKDKTLNKKAMNQRNSKAKKHKKHKIIISNS